MTAAEQMHMKMIDGLAAVGTRIHDDAVALSERFVARNLCGDCDKMAEQRRVRCGGFRERCDVFARNDEDMCWSLGADVSEGITFGVLIHGSRGNASIDDFAEQAAHNGTSVPTAALHAAARYALAGELWVWPSVKRCCKRIQCSLFHSVQ